MKLIFSFFDRLNDFASYLENPGGAPPIGQKANDPEIGATSEPRFFFYFLNHEISELNFLKISVGDLGLGDLSGPSPGLTPPQNLTPLFGRKKFSFYFDKILMNFLIQTFSQNIFEEEPFWKKEKEG